MRCLKRKKPHNSARLPDRNSTSGKGSSRGEKTYFHCVEDCMERLCTLTFLQHRKYNTQRCYGQYEELLGKKSNEIAENIIVYTSNSQIHPYRPRDPSSIQTFLNSMNVKKENYQDETLWLKTWCTNLRDLSWTGEN